MTEETLQINVKETDHALKAIRINGHPYAAIKPGEDIMMHRKNEKRKRGFG